MLRGSLLVLLMLTLPGLCRGVPSQKILAQPYQTAIPFRYDPATEPYIVVSVSINGGPDLSLAVDTGCTAAPLILDSRVVERLHLPLGRKETVDFGFGKTTWTRSRVRRLVVHGEGHKNLSYNLPIATAVMDLSYFGISDHSSKPSIVGIIGASLLSVPLTFQFDFARKRIYVDQSSPPRRLPPGATLLKLFHRPHDRYFHLNAFFDTGQPRDFVLDTGSYDTWVKETVFCAVPAVRSVKVREYGVGEAAVEDAIQVSTLRIGDLHEPNVNLDPAHGDLTRLGLNCVGLDFLSRFRITMNLSAGWLLMERGQDYAHRLVPEGRADVDLTKDGDSVTVAWVLPRSPAEIGGLQPGDQVLSIDTRPVHGMVLWAVQRLLEGSAGTRANLVIRRAGQERRLFFERLEKLGGLEDATLGLRLVRSQGKWLIYAVRPNCAAAKAGLAYGDLISQVDGVTVDGFGSGQILTLLNNAAVQLTAYSVSQKKWLDISLHV